MTPRELYHAVRSTGDDKTVAAFAKSNTSRSQIHVFVLDASKGLVEIVDDYPLSRFRVQFIHETVREYLNDGGMGRLDTSLSTNLVGKGNDTLCRACVRYPSVASPDLSPAPITSQSFATYYARRVQALKLHPLLKYVDEYLVKHAELAQIHGISQTSFAQGFALELLIKLRNIFECHFTDSDRPLETRTYMLAFSRAPRLLQLELSNGSGELDNESRGSAVARHLCSSEATKSASEGWYGHPLQAAVINKDSASVKLLIDHGANVNAEGGRWHTALQAAAWSGAEDMVKFLVESGADINIRGGECDTALKAAIISGSMNIVRFLIEYGADVNAKGGAGNLLASHFEALHVAAMAGKTDIVRLLMERGAHGNAQRG